MKKKNDFGSLNINSMMKNTMNTAVGITALGVSSTIMQKAMSIK